MFLLLVDGQRLTFYVFPLFFFSIHSNILNNTNFKYHIAFLREGTLKLDKFQQFLSHISPTEKQS